MTRRILFHENGIPVIGPFSGTSNFYKSLWNTSEVTSTFVLQNGTLTADNPLEIYINGALVVDNTSYTRDVENNAIVMNESIPSGSSVYIKLYSF